MARRESGVGRRCLLLGLGALPLAAIAATDVASAAETSRWKRAESVRFVVYSDGNEEVLADYVRRLEDFDMVLRVMHGMPVDEAPPRKLDIYLVNDLRALRRAYPTAGDTIRGYYTATEVDILAVALRGRVSDKETDDTVLHEYVHHFMKQYFNFAYAPWLVEGYAEYFMTTQFKADSIIVGGINSNRGQWLMNTAWPPLEGLLTKSYGELKGADQEMYYPQAWLLTHYMMSDPARYAQLQTYMKSVGEGVPGVTAMEQATGKTLAVLQVDLRAYTRTNLPVRVFIRKRQHVVEVRTSAMPASADDFLLERARLVQPLAKEDRAAYIEDLTRRAARYPGDPLATLTLARAKLQAQDPVGAQGVLDPWLARNPEDVEALQMKAEALMNAGDDDPAQREALYKDAQGVLGRAFKLDGGRYQVLLAYARSRRLSPGYPSQNVMDVLLAANDLAPQVGAVTLAAVNVLTMRREYAQAVTLLKPLANDPHGGGEGSSARQFLARLEQLAAAQSTRSAAQGSSGNAAVDKAASDKGSTAKGAAKPRG